MADVVLPNELFPVEPTAHMRSRSKSNGNPALHLNLAIACSVSILEAFKGYTVILEQGGQTFSENEQQATEVDALASGMNGRRKKRDSRGDVAPMKRDEGHGREQPLQVHIGIGFGELWHVFVGSERRAEYFVAGRAVVDAGKALDLGKSGQVVVLERALKAYDSQDRMLAAIRNCFELGDGMFALDVESLGLLQIKKELRRLETERKADRNSDGMARRLSKKEMSSTLHNEGDFDARSVLTGSTRSRASSTNGQVPGAITSHDHPSKGLSPLQLAFLEPSLAKYAEASRMRLDDYQQLRTVTVLFLHMSSFQPFSLDFFNPSGDAALAVLSDLQFLAESLFNAASKNGGTCRQVNFDDKGISALVVWGIEGFAHERGDQPFAVAAASSLVDSLAKRRWSVEGARISIAVTCGKAYTGTIGTKERSEGTVLGPCVNLAARIMCQPTCRGKFLCDTSIVSACSGNFEFVSEGVLTLKGIPNPVSVYSVNGGLKRADSNAKPTTHKSFSLRGETGNSVYNRNASVSTGANNPVAVFEGRDREWAVLEELYHTWWNGGRGAAVAVGKSGFGKTYLAEQFLNHAMKDSDTVVCSGWASENRNDPMNIYEQIFCSIYSQLKARGFTAEKIRSSLPWMDSESWDVTLEVLDLKPFILMTSRPKEEYKTELQSRFNQLTTVSHVTILALDKLSLHAAETLILADVKAVFPWVSKIHPKLVDNLYEKSQGTPMVLRLLIKLVLNSNAALGIPNALGTFGSNLVDSAIPDDVSTAVVSQLDRFAGDVKNVLRVASVGGQFFRFVELQWVLSKLYPQSPDMASERTLHRILLEAIRGGFLATKSLKDHLEPEDVFSFGHYLLCNGVYQSLLSARREEIHGWYADFYEEELANSPNAAQNLTGLTYHLLKIPGQVERKVKFVRRTFLMFAERMRPAESIAYYKTLEELREGLPAGTDNPFENVKELRLYGTMLFEDGKAEEAFDAVYGALDKLGFHMREYRTRPLKLLMMICGLFFNNLRLFNAKPTTRLVLSAKYLKRKFPAVTGHVNPNTIRAQLRGKTLLPDPAKEALPPALQELSKIATEIEHTCAALLQILYHHVPPNLEMVYMMGVNLPNTTCSMDAIRYTGALGTFTLMLQVVGLVRDGRRVAEAVFSQMVEVLQMNLEPSAALAMYLYMGAVLAGQSYAEWDLYLLAEDARYETFQQLGTILLNISLHALWFEHQEDPLWLAKAFKAVAIIRKGVGMALPIQKLFITAPMIILTPRILDLFLVVETWKSSRDPAHSPTPILDLLDAIVANAREGCRAHPATLDYFVSLRKALGLLVKNRPEKAAPIFHSIAEDTTRFKTLTGFMRTRLAARVVALSHMWGARWKGRGAIQLDEVMRTLHQAGHSAEIKMLQTRLELV
ncbi:hypothetical protein HDU96_010488 [Phlyctochytrium bullatum]|nr:hypothetical protein HDU96_010488 [Phlyctochytrium bullatum]